MLRQPRFWLLNAALLLLYVWTLTETATVTVAAGQCTAVFQEPFGTRPSQIACPGVSGGKVGLFLQDEHPYWLESGPLDWLLPGTAWSNVQITGPGAAPERIVLHDTDLGGWSLWRARFGNGETAVATWSAPNEPFTITAAMRRPLGEAGILLLDAQENGWLFLTAPQRWQAVWWRWQDGAAVTVMQGIPQFHAIFVMS
ncbi:MAG: hypothetical protein KC443_21280 [Anaerolineales bacterium]|nr:hypothetical protein [Anaerolineales bacterium]